MGWDSLAPLLLTSNLEPVGQPRPPQNVMPAGAPGPVPLDGSGGGGLRPGPWVSVTEAWLSVSLPFALVCLPSLALSVLGRL